MNNLFICENIAPNSTSLVLDPTESKHIVQVLRLKPKDEIWVTNGKGEIFKCRLTNTSIPTSAEIIETLSVNKRKYQLHIGISLLQNPARWEWFLEKSCEIGIDRITPLRCQRTQKQNCNTERLYKKIHSACKQSLNPFFPILDEPTRFSDFIQAIEPEQTAYIAHCRSDLPKEKPQKKETNNYIILIGPEGDFTEEEIHQALQNGYSGISLTESRLRTETAGIVATTFIAGMY